MGKIWDFGKFSSLAAIIDEHGCRMTYETLNSEAQLLAERIGHRCLVFSLCRNETGSVLGYVSFINNGIVPLLLNSRMEEELLKNLLEAYEPSYLWVPRDQAEQFHGMKEEYSAYNYVLLKTDYEKNYPLYSELGLLLTTSGSTGSRKLVRQSYVNVLDNAQAIVKYLELDASERPITTLPMNYTYGLSIINSHFLVGATLLMTEKTLMQKEFWTFFKEYEATSFGGVPYTYEMLDRLNFYRMKLPSLCTMTQAGGKLQPELHGKLAKYAEGSGRKFVVMYGQCEATARMGYLPPERAAEKKGSMGIAIPGGCFHLIDENGNKITEAYTTGELIYEGKNVTLGYAECGEDLDKGDERHGILKTEDMAQFDDDGYYYIVGRKKRFLKIYGNRVSLDETERMIKGRFGIETAAAGVDDHIYIFVTAEKAADSVRDFVIGKTRLNPAAFKVIVIDEIPKNDSGKILYKELNKYYE